MTSPINPLGGVGHDGRAAPAPAPAAESGDFAATLRELESEPGTVGREDIESSPPQSVRDEMAQASRTHDALAASGREVRFEASADGTVAVSLHQSSGARIAVLQLQDIYTLIAQEGGQ